MELWISGSSYGLCYCMLGLGVYITFRILNFPDITADGSLVTGGAVTAVILDFGLGSYVALGASFVAGFLAGTATGLIHTKLRVNALLSGILVTTSLYTVNLWIMKKSNIPLLNEETMFSLAVASFPFLGSYASSIFLLVIINTIVIVLLALMFKTTFGLAMRATGSNSVMVVSQGINPDFMKMVGIGSANALIAVSGGIVAQYQGYADINMGIGTIVYGLASVIIGESMAKLVFRKGSTTIYLASVVVGSIAFRLFVSLAIRLGLNNEIKLITAILVLIAVSLPSFRLTREN